MNIYEKLAAITSELDPVAKSLNVKIGNGSYKAVSEYSVLDAVKPLENKYKVYSYPVNRSIVNQCVMENDNGRKSVFVRVETTYRFVNIEKPEEFIDVISCPPVIDAVIYLLSHSFASCISIYPRINRDTHMVSLVHNLSPVGRYQQGMRHDDGCPLVHALRMDSRRNFCISHLPQR